MHYRMKPRLTLPSVKSGDSRYDEEYAAHARAELRRFVEERTQVEAARLMGVNQATISRNLHPSRQPSFRILIRLAKATHRTIDEIIGLRHEKSSEARISDSSILRVAKAVADEVMKKLPSDRPPPPRPLQKKKR